jgi:hypothetical protein
VITAGGTNKFEQMLSDVVVAALVDNSRYLSQWTPELSYDPGIRGCLPLKYSAINSHTARAKPVHKHSSSEQCRFRSVHIHC